MLSNLDLKFLLLIFLVSIFCKGFAQDRKFKGIWVEYKREVVGEPNSCNYTYKNSSVTSDLVFYFENDSLCSIEYENFHLYKLNNDTIRVFEYDRNGDNWNSSSFMTCKFYLSEESLII